ncbi:FHA domain-containing protein [Bacillus sp. 1P06AnD]|uniref:FHA domain-containing protein n=1 Tax=Bacillus sp. 1P06AnD TaxID=3132208 RepID=UPI0039A1526F
MDPYKLMLKTIHTEPRGEYVYIYEGQSVLIGRASLHTRADFPVYNDFVSREHCKLYMENGKLYIMDLASKHGTELNGMKLAPMEPILWTTGDQLTLISGMIEFKIEHDDQNTRELSLKELQSIRDVVLNDSLQNVLIENEVIKMPAKEYICFKLLFENMNEVITKSSIIDQAWPERKNTMQPWASDEEISSLIYRIRKRMKPYFSIKSIPHKGYYMERL